MAINPNAPFDESEVMPWERLVPPFGLRMALMLSLTVICQMAHANMW